MLHRHGHGINGVDIAHLRSCIEHRTIRRFVDSKRPRNGNRRNLLFLRRIHHHNLIPGWIADEESLGFQIEDSPARIQPLEIFSNHVGPHIART
jgi:hypothetical protein